jgi:hypothetical protein
MHEEGVLQGCGPARPSTEGHAAIGGDEEVARSQPPYGRYPTVTIEGGGTPE